MANGQLKRGDIVVNTYGSKGFNDLHIVVGGTKYLDTKLVYKNKLSHKCRFSRSDTNLVKIGHYDIDAPIIEAMQKAYKNYSK